MHIQLAVGQSTKFNVYHRNQQIPIDSCMTVSDTCIYIAPSTITTAQSASCVQE